jgi:hypothetical protein
MLKKNKGFFLDSKIKQNKISKKYQYYKHIQYLMYLKIHLEKTIRPNLLKIQRNLKKLRRWGNQIYYKNVHFIFYRLLFIKKFLFKMSLLLSRIAETFVLERKQAYLLSEKKTTVIEKKKEYSILLSKLNRILLENSLDIEKDTFKKEIRLHLE